MENQWNGRPAGRPDCRSDARADGRVDGTSISFHASTEHFGIEVSMESLRPNLGLGWWNLWRWLFPQLHMHWLLLCCGGGGCHRCSRCSTLPSPAWAPPPTSFRFNCTAGHEAIIIVWILVVREQELGISLEVKVVVVGRPRRHQEGEAILAVLHSQLTQHHHDVARVP